MYLITPCPDTRLAENLFVDEYSHLFRNIPTTELMCLIHESLEGSPKSLRLNNELTSDFIAANMGAYRVVAQREGPDYVLSYFGFKQPKTFLERLGFWLFGTLPQF